MFNKPRYILSLLFCFVALQVAISQEDVTIEYGVDTVSQVGKYDRIYQVVSESKVNVNTLIKFDAVQWGQLHPSITVEQRIWNDLTVEPSLTVNSLNWSRAEGIQYALRPEVAFKYYYNRSRRERLGKNVVGFTGDYFAVGMNYTITDDKVYYNYALGESYITLPGGVNDLESSDLMSHYSWFAMYGMHYRFGKVAFADVSAGVTRNYFGEYGVSKVLPTIRIKIGFALSKEQFIRFTR